MELEIIELKNKIEVLTRKNAELMADKQEYSSAKQSFFRMSARLRKLCKRLTPTTETVIEMRNIADEIRELTKQIVFTLNKKSEVSNDELDDES